MKIIVGLGNPELKYNKTRHNAGFMALDALAEEFSLPWENNKKFSSIIAKGENFLLAKPQTFMNNSGRAVTAIMAYYKLLPKKLGFIKTAQADLADSLTVIHDDLDILLGQYKISVDSRSAGHNGVQSIIDMLKTKNFRRLRIGIRTPALEKIPAEKFVMQKFNDQELQIIKNLLPEIVKQNILR